MWYKECNLEILHVGFKIKLVLHQHRHFHPSGHLIPSQEDIALTQKLKEIGQLLQVPVNDHFIVTTDDYYSFAENQFK